MRFGGSSPFSPFSGIWGTPLPGQELGGFGVIGCHLIEGDLQRGVLGCHLIGGHLGDTALRRRPIGGDLGHGYWVSSYWRVTLGGLR